MYDGGAAFWSMVADALLCVAFVHLWRNAEALRIGNASGSLILHHWRPGTYDISLGGTYYIPGWLEVCKAVVDLWSSIP
jgi:hypothetical protein